MVHLRIVAPHEEAQQALALLKTTTSACHLVHLEGVAQRPDGDMILVDVPREEASVVLGDLKELGIHETGSISVEPIEVQLSARADQAERTRPARRPTRSSGRRSRRGRARRPGSRGTFLAFMVLAGLIAPSASTSTRRSSSSAAMVVGPEFGPIAAFCVAVGRAAPAGSRRSLAGARGRLPARDHRGVAREPRLPGHGRHARRRSATTTTASRTIANPDFFAFFVAFCAGVAGMLSLSTAKSGALIGVLISVTTIPAAANIGVAAAYGDWDGWRGSLAQLAINVAGDPARRDADAVDPAAALPPPADQAPEGERATGAGRPQRRRGASATSPATTRPRASSAPGR